MNLEEMWTTFCHLDPFFIYKYIAYHHFRSKGWVVKPGIKFGTHFSKAYIFFCLHVLCQLVSIMIMKLLLAIVLSPFSSL